MRKLFILIFTVAAFATMAQKATVGLKLEPGSTYKQNLSTKATIVQDMGGQKLTITMTIKGAMSYHVKGVANNVFDMDVKYESLSMKMELPQATMEFSSDKKDEKDIFSTILGSI